MNVVWWVGDGWGIEGLVVVVAGYDTASEVWENRRLNENEDRYETIGRCEY